MIETANRLKSVPEYYFATKLREVRNLTQQGKPIINAGIGSPDLLPPDHVVPALIAALQDPQAHAYQSYMGLPELRQSMTEFYNSHYRVTLDPETEIIPLMGSKEGILHISLAFLNAGDHVLIPDPGYPAYASATLLCEAHPVAYNLTAANEWMPDFEALEKSDLSKVKLMWTNYPNMPTGAPASMELFEKLVSFAKRHNILLINDNPYSCLGNKEKLSIHQVEGSRDCVMELNSISKTFNMAGWRVGMLTGNASVLKEVLKVKTNMDSGMFYGVQKGAIAALKTPESWLLNQDKTYENRRKLIKQVATALGLKPHNQLGGLFVWCKIPDIDVDDKTFVDQLLHKHHIFIAPGSVFGKNGKGYVRFSLCVKEDDLATMLDRVSKEAAV
ncbi:pyridoxal phosphate-dependent aminotransferase [Nonlabens antarcticus]|uniref:pyridoxal phosphate-dependent aminotransferase n=1 Tax=Nonlabens antarcticus TaxID=392714 RepID=UPI0018912454|nr:aminotransferase class I/II-fold pyridoxal phosphate-dependent enzyme [Nonlabens antarcticus]